MSNRDVVIYLAAGLSVWLNGALTFRLGGRFLFENGWPITVVVGVVIAGLVCAAFRATMAWRKTDASQAVMVAVLMALPGLFGETARQVVFSWVTGLPPTTASSFAAVIFFGNAALMTYAAVLWRRAARGGAA